MNKEYRSDTPVKVYHTDLDRDDFEPGELLPWQDMSRHLQALEHQVKTLEQALQTTTDSLRQAHQKIAWHEERIGIEYKPNDSYEGECERCGRLGLLNEGGRLCKGCVLDDIMYPGRAN